MNTHSLHSSAINGLLELAAADPAFAPYEHTLFSASAMRSSRKMQSADVNSKLDRTIEGFLVVVSPHFLSSAAQKTLQFIVHQLAAHAHNAPAFVECILAYHSTRFFVQIARQLRFDTGDTLADAWRAICPHGPQGAPPSRGALVESCLHHPAMLQAMTVGKT